MRWFRQIAKSNSKARDILSSLQARSLSNSWFKPWWKAALGASSFHPLPAASMYNSRTYSLAFHFSCLGLQWGVILWFACFGKNDQKTLSGSSTKWSYVDNSSPPWYQTAVTQSSALHISKLRNRALVRDIVLTQDTRRAPQQEEFSPEVTHYNLSWQEISELGFTARDQSETKLKEILIMSLSWCCRWSPTHHGISPDWLRCIHAGNLSFS